MAVDYNRKLYAVRFVKSDKTIGHHNEQQPADATRADGTPYGPGAAWRDESFSAERTFGAARSKVGTHRAGVYTDRGGPVYDCRVISEHDAAILEGYELEIARLQRTRREFLADRFQTWAIAKRDDFDAPRPGWGKPTKAEAQAEIANETPRTAAQIKRERGVVDDINRAFRA